MVVVCTDEFLSGREYADIVHKRSRVSESASAVCTDDDLLDRHVLQCHTRRHLEALAIEPVAPQSCDCRELVTCMVCILSEHACICKIGDALLLCCNRSEHPYASDEILIIAVKCSVKAEGESVRIVYHILVQEVSECGMLAGKILCRAEV